VRESVGGRGLRDVGDGQRGALETRAFLQAGGDASLCPLAEGQRPPRVLEAYVESVSSGHQPVTRSTRLTATGTRPHLADGYARLDPLTAEVAGARLAWAERRLVVRSYQRARAGKSALRARVAKARAAGAALNTRGRGQPRFTELPPLPAAVEASLTRYRVQGLRAVQDPARVQPRPLRRYGSRPATVQVARHVRVKVVVDRHAVATAIGRVGWRVYATTAPSDQLPLAQAVLAYRSHYLVERDIGRLQGHPLSVPPMYVERDDHATGLIRRLSVGWRVLTRRACVVRQRLAAARTVLAGL